MSAKWYTPRQLADEWGVSEQTVVNECQRRRLRHMRVGRQYRIHRSAKEEYERRATAAEQQPQPPVLLGGQDVPDEIGNAEA